MTNTEQVTITWQGNDESGIARCDSPIVTPDQIPRTSNYQDIVLTILKIQDPVSFSDVDDDKATYSNLTKQESLKDDSKIEIIIPIKREEPVDVGIKNHL